MTCPSFCCEEKLEGDILIPVGAMQRKGDFGCRLHAFSEFISEGRVQALYMQEAFRSERQEASG